MLREMRIPYCTEVRAVCYSMDHCAVGDDTGLLVLLCYHASLESHDFLFCPEPKKNTKQPGIWNIKTVKQRLGPDICQHILFMHAVSHWVRYNISPPWDLKGTFPQEIPNEQCVW